MTKTICNDCGSEYIYSEFLQCQHCPICTPKKLTPFFQSESFQKIWHAKLNENTISAKIAKAQGYRDQYGIQTAQQWYNQVMKQCVSCYNLKYTPCPKHIELGKLIDYANLPGDIKHVL